MHGKLDDLFLIFYKVNYCFAKYLFTFLLGEGRTTADNSISFIRHMYKYRCNRTVFIQEVESFVVFFLTKRIKDLSVCLILLLSVDPLGFGPDGIYVLYYFVNV